MFLCSPPPCAFLGCHTRQADNLRQFLNDAAEFSPVLIHLRRIGGFKQLSSVEQAHGDAGSAIHSPLLETLRETLTGLQLRQRHSAALSRVTLSSSSAASPRSLSTLSGVSSLDPRSPCVSSVSSHSALASVHPMVLLVASCESADQLGSGGTGLRSCFGHQVSIGVPDTKQRKELLGFYLDKVPLLPPADSLSAAELLSEAKGEQIGNASDRLTTQVANTLALRTAGLSPGDLCGVVADAGLISLGRFQRGADVTAAVAVSATAAGTSSSSPHSSSPLLSSDSDVTIAASSAEVQLPSSSVASVGNELACSSSLLASSVPSLAASEEELYAEFYDHPDHDDSSGGRGVATSASGRHAASRACHSVAIASEDFEKALHFLQQRMASAVGTIAKIPNVTWKDIGGLEHVKRQILDTIELPLRYPQFFAAGKS